MIAILYYENLNYKLFISKVDFIFFMVILNKLKFDLKNFQSEVLVEVLF